jgi:hypothetical protein
MTEFKHGPYGGYLAQVTHDYFAAGGLRPSHDAVFAGMDPSAAEVAREYMPDLRPFGNATPALLAELPRATLGAWGNYLGDLYRGDIAPVEARREVAVRTTLTMGMLAAAEDTLRQTPGARTAEQTDALYSSLHVALIDGKVPLNSVVKFDVGPHTPMWILGMHLHSRARLENPLDEVRREAFAGDIWALAEATKRRFALPQIAAQEMLGVAMKMGRVTATMALRHTTMPALRDEVTAPPLNLPGEKAALMLGKIGGVIAHGDHAEAAFRGNMPTYATATIKSGGGPTKSALEAVTQNRKDTVNDLRKKGLEMLGDGTEQQRGIFRMAVRLLETRHRKSHHGSPKAIDDALTYNTFWKA